MSSSPAVPRVLIADDDPQGLELLETYLSDSGYETRTATDGEQTLKQIQEWKPDVVLLDVMMPKISGFQVCKRIRADAASRGMGVLMITALDQPSDVDRALDAGTDDFLTKPINKTELLRRVRAMLESCRQPRDLDRALAYIEALQRDTK